MRPPHLARGLSEAAAESFDKLVSPKYNGEAKTAEERIGTHLQQHLCKVYRSVLASGEVTERIMVPLSKFVVGRGGL